MPTMADRTLANPKRGCGHLKRGKAYLRGVIGSPGGLLPSFVEADPPIPFREMGTDGGFTRGFLRFDGLTSQLATEGDLADYVARYPGEASLDGAKANHVDRGIYQNHGAVPDAQSQRHVDRIRSRPLKGDHWGEVPATAQTDLVMRAGKTHYPDPSDFVDEAIEHGLSKAIPVSARQDPPNIYPGVTRLWIVHPDTDVGWAVIGFGYLQEVVYTEPADGNVPDYIQDYQAQGNLDVVDIEEPDEDDGPDASIEDFADNGDPDEAADVDANPGGQTAEDGMDGSAPDDDVDGIGAVPDDRGDVVVPSSGDGPDVQTLDADTIDGMGYNELKAAAGDLGLDVGTHPSKDDLQDHLLDYIDADGSVA